MSREDFETVDGSRPEAVPLSAAAGRRMPVSAFTLLSGGDVFEMVNGRAPPEGPARARAYVQQRISFDPHGAPREQVERVQGDIVRQISGNLQRIGRLDAARPIAVDLIPPGQVMAKYGYPKVVSKNAAGLFWDHPSWERARMALRQERLGDESHLVFHEMAHAIHYLAFTEEERELIYRTMLRTYRSHAAVDEVFAIYSEREFVPQVSAEDLRAPGVYGMARARWDEGHVFTRFVRNLYFPYKPLAGPPSTRGGGYSHLLG
jgi:hypothetical protein